VREVFREVVKNCPEEHLEAWARNHKNVFLIPSSEELKIVAEMMTLAENRNLIKRQNILKGLPVADPFLIAAAKYKGAIVVTKEGDRPGAKIPSICRKQSVECISLREFFNREQIKY
jgi:hypothetical protein